MKSTKITYWISGAALAITMIIVIISMFRSEKKFDLSDPALFKDYISAYSNDVISKNDVIAIQLTDEFVNKIKDKETDIFDIYPDVDGTVTWKENNIVEFKPAKPLESGKVYHVTLDLGTLSKDVPEEAEEFVFRVQTKHQIMSLIIDKVTTTDRQKFTKQDVSGKIKLNDAEELENVKKCISAEIDGDDVAIEIEKAGDTEFVFTVRDITRTTKKQTLTVEFEGESIGSKSSGYKEIDILPLDEFAVLDIQVNQYPEQFVNIIFSDPVKEDQILDGLIKLTDVENIKFIVIDNNVKIIPTERLEKSYKMEISTGVVNIHDKRLKETVSETVSFVMRKPAVGIVDEGVIIPTSTDGQVVSFMAVNVKAVDVRILKIYENNILQFLQENSLNSSYDLNKVGKVIKTKTISLEQTDVEDFGDWNTFYLNLSDIIKPDPGAIYRVEIGFRKENAIYPCTSASESGEQNAKTENLRELKEDGEWDWFTNYTYSGNYEEYYFDDYYYEDYSYEGDYYEEEYYYDNYYYYDDYSSGGRNTYEDPCNKNYYGYRRAIKFNILASDIGLIGKMGKDKKIFAFVTNLLTAEPISGAKVEAYNYQQQVIGTGSTDYEGKAVIELPENDKAYFLVASSNGQKSYLKLEEYGSLRTSEFDVSGDYIQGGTKAFIYTERGVWRPGDSIYVGFIMNEISEPVPVGHPIVFEVRNPKNQVVYSEVQKKNEKGFHVFKFKTELNDPTGYYYAKFTIGGMVFSKSLMVETIRPNRLNVDLSLDKKYLAGDGSVKATVKATWLHGADAADLKTEVTMSLSNKYSPFEKYQDYNFSNQMSSFDFTTQSLLSGTTDANGEYTTSVKFDKVKTAPGVLNATLTTKVFEKGGEFSIGEQSVVYYPYTDYVGIKMPAQENYSYSLPTETDFDLDIVNVNREQKLSTGTRDLEVSVYMIEYSWWYDYQDDGADFISANYNNAISREKVNCSNGKASTKVKFDDNGDYLIVVKDLKGGHISSMRVYASSYASASSSESTAVDILKFSTEKDSYNVGEKVNIKIPAGSGKALVSIENSQTVLSTFWVESDGKNLNISFDAVPEMAPNIYVNISYIQEHARTKNSRPIRMYGIIPVFVEDPATHLYPVINMPEELLAESKVRIQVREKNGKAMTYTLAMVDEGLLNITNFKTPDPWSFFYSKEALGVRTWDIFNYVIGAFSVDGGKMLSIGGGDNGLSPEDLAQAIRFKPMVRFIGPFTLAPGASNMHEIQLPQYIGSVRTMVIAAEGSSFGSAEKTTPVKKPLMILGSAPRVLGTNETFNLPVTVFAMKPDVKNVSISVKTNDLLSIEGGTSKSLTFTKEGEKYVNFTLNSKAKTGVAKIEITATSGSHVSKFNIELDLRQPNVKMTDVIEGTTGTSDFTLNLNPFGVEGSNETYLEIYTIHQ
jgi:alpha-2-macroglobulin